MAKELNSRLTCWRFEDSTLNRFHQPYPWRRPERRNHRWRGRREEAWESRSCWITCSDDGESTCNTTSLHTVSSSKYTLLRRISMVLVRNSSSSNAFSFYSSTPLIIHTSLSWAIPKYSTSRKTLRLVSRFSAGGWLIDSFSSHSTSYLHMKDIASNQTNHHYDHALREETTGETLPLIIRIFTYAFTQIQKNTATSVFKEELTQIRGVSTQNSQQTHELVQIRFRNTCKTLDRYNLLQTHRNDRTSGIEDRNCLLREILPSINHRLQWQGKTTTTSPKHC